MAENILMLKHNIFLIYVPNFSKQQNDSKGDNKLTKLYIFNILIDYKLGENIIFEKPFDTKIDYKESKYKYMKHANKLLSIFETFVNSHNISIICGLMTETKNNEEKFCELLPGSQLKELDNFFKDKKTKKAHSSTDSGNVVNNRTLYLIRANTLLQFKNPAYEEITAYIMNNNNKGIEAIKTNTKPKDLDVKPSHIKRMVNYYYEKFLVEEIKQLV